MTKKVSQPMSSPACLTSVLIGTMLLADPVLPNLDGMEIESRVASRLMEFEGFSPTTYIDTTGHLTIGYGHKLSPEYVSHAPMSREAAAVLLCEDVIAAHLALYRLFPDLDTMPEPAQEALIHMSFQLGITGLSRFSNLKKALSLLPSPNYNLAAVECIHSRWASQTPKRARFCAALFGGIK